MINIEEFSKVEIRLGQIIEANKIEEADRLLKLKVNFGLVKKENDEEVEDVRQIVSGIAKYYENPEELVGKKCFFVTNLEHRKIKGYESEGMICAVSDEEENFSLVVPDKDVKIGLKIK